MKVAGIIAEYNPFHNGHKYQLDEVRLQTNADYIITAISGNFVQRGEPSLIDKYTRTKMALLGGADIVIELPTIGACSSAEYFARTGVNILNSTGVVNQICYGVENDNHELFKKIVKIIINDNFFITIQSQIQQHIKNGLSYPVAREKALMTISQEKFEDDISLLENFFSLPNNILALEYEKAIYELSLADNNLLLKGYPIQRIGSGYNDKTIESEFASATGIRHLINSDFLTNNKTENIKKTCPESTFNLLMKNTSRMIFPEALSSTLYYKLLLYKDQGYENFADCTEELSCKIANNLYKYTDYEQFCSLLKSKNLTLSRIKRVLLHILLDIKQSDYSLLQKTSYSPYLRILGFKKEASSLLHEIKEKASAPIITKVADASKILSLDEITIFEKDIFASDFYRSLTFPASSNYNEYTKGIIIM